MSGAAVVRQTVGWSSIARTGSRYIRLGSTNNRRTSAVLGRVRNYATTGALAASRSRAERNAGGRSLCAAYGSKFTVAVSVALAPAESVTVRMNV